MEILTITAEVDPTNPIQLADVCDAIIEHMTCLKDRALQEEHFPKTGTLVIPDGNDEELVGDWVIEPKRKRR